MKIFKTKPGVFTIPPEVDFLAALSKGLDHIQDELDIPAPDITLYLPTQRSIRAFQAHQMKKTGGGPVLLPNLKAIGALDEDDVLLTSIASLEDELELPPAITPMARVFYLQKEIERLGKTAGLKDLSTPQRLMLARELARLLDQMQNANLSFKKLEDLAPERFAVHWQEILGFLKIVSKTWPERLETLGLMDPVARRKTLVKRLTQSWRKSPPETPVIAAGSTGSVPLTRALLKAIAGLPRGAVILPGLDRDMDLEAWDEAGETHPQYAMKQTLKDLSIGRAKVADWPFSGAPGGKAAARLDFFKKALVPAAATTRWHVQKFDQKSVMKSFAVEVCPTPRAEAGVIALMMRRCLEDKKKTAALVTPDRELAARVKSELERWDIEVDDSAGTPLLTTPPGAFFLLLVEMIESRFSPVALLSFLKHPLTTLGLGRADLLNLARILDRQVLRGVAPGGGLAGLKNKIKGLKRLEKKTRLLALIKALSKQTEGVSKALRKKRTSFSGLLARHIEAAASLSRPGDEKTPLVWTEMAGEHLAGFLARLEADAPQMDDIQGAEYPGVIRALMEGEKVRRNFSAHPRLYIWGALEARLQRPDLVILGGLNEGAWPQAGGADPWMSREMRHELGLPTPDFRVGQSAHDFYLALGAPEVLITRSDKIEGAPATPSRWLQRARALLRGRLPGPGDPWLAWFEALDVPGELIALQPPAPKPKAKDRPARLSVTGIEKLMHDPYSIFARYILKLDPLDELEADPGAADKGLLLHEVFEVFLRENDFRLPENAFETLVETGDKVFKKSGYTRPAVHAFWWPRFVEVAKGFIAAQSEREKAFRVLAAEVKGAHTFKTGKNALEIHATADRIDEAKKDGGLYIIDYKSGSLPKKAEMAKGSKPQLPLEALIAEAGGFDKIKGGKVAGLEFWNVGKPCVELEIQTTAEDLKPYLEAARGGISALIDYFADPANPYLAVPDPSGHRFGDFDPLSRYHEWQNRPQPEGEKS